MAVDETGVDETAVDKTGVDELGINLSISVLPFPYFGFRFSIFPLAQLLAFVGVILLWI